MSHVANSTIAQVIYANPQNCNFVRVVAELETLLARMRNTVLQTRWDCDDVVVFDIGETRIVLGWSENMKGHLPACLLVSVGPMPAAANAAQDPSHDKHCIRLVERIQSRYTPDAVLWHQLPLAIELEMVDALTDALPSIQQVLHLAAPARPVTEPAMRQRIRSVPWPANDAPHLPPCAENGLQRVRATLDPQIASSDAESVHLRLAAQAMNATLIVVWMPLGVFVMAYSLMKGKNFGFSARMMAMTGSLMAFSKTPLGQQMVAMAGP